MKDILPLVLMPLFLAFPSLSAGAPPKPGGPFPPPASISRPARQGGDTFADAFEISSLPFDDTGSTVGYAVNYAEMCPSDIWAPDVVYRYAPADTVFVWISLCNPGTDYDSGLLIYRNTPADLIACNDDACTGPDYPYPYLSRVSGIRMAPGSAYYIVISGYAPQAGNYHITMDAIPDPLLVRADGSGFFPDIQSAIYAAGEGDVIRLADGVFRGEGNRNLDYHGKPITVRSQSGDPTACVIDCEQAGRGFLFQSGESASAILEGVTIRNGLVPEYYGAGGAIVTSTSYPTIRHCRLENNQADQGGALAILGAWLPQTIEDCVFVGNRASIRGGAIHVDNGITNNPPPAFTGCTFTGNTALAIGGAISSFHSSPAFLSCTLVKNSVTGAGGFGGAIGTEGTGLVSLERTIVAFNMAPVVGGVRVTGATAVCCDVYGNQNGDWGGVPDPTGQDGNISLDPRFCDYENRDFHLAEDSPCAPFSPPNEECDLIGAWPVACAPTSVEEAPLQLPTTIRVVPNPSAGPCRIILSGAIAAGARVSILDPSGRLVRNLPVSGPRSIDSVLTWDGRDDRGHDLPSGVYYLRMDSAPGYGLTRIIRVR